MYCSKCNSKTTSASAAKVPAGLASTIEAMVAQSVARAFAKRRGVNVVVNDYEAPPPPRVFDDATTGALYDSETGLPVIFPIRGRTYTNEAPRGWADDLADKQAAERRRVAENADYTAPPPPSVWPK